MGLLELVMFALLGAAAGFLIGCVGIGGVILVPVLVYAAGVPVHAAVAAALSAFLVSGVVGLYYFARAGTVDWRTTGWLCLGAAPASFAGALLANAVPGTYIELAIGPAAAAAGLHALLRRDTLHRRAAPLPAPALATTGAATGLASALTGTGGPLVLVPILLWLELPTLTAIGAAQAIQLPIAAAATGGNLLGGTLDVGLGLTIGLGIALGTAAGARLAHALAVARLRSLVAALLVVAGAAILLRIAVGG